LWRRKKARFLLKNWHSSGSYYRFKPFWNANKKNRKRKKKISVYNYFVAWLAPSKNNKFDLKIGEGIVPHNKKLFERGCPTRLHKFTRRKRKKRRKKK